MKVRSNYIGRFAPSPTGPLHFGSLVAALASFLDARHHNGRWLLRIEDLDPPREQAEAPDIIMEQLKFLGLTWDDEVSFQSQRLNRYAECLDQLNKANKVFSCTCSRKSFDQVYPGRCRGKQPSNQVPYAVRLQVEDEIIEFFDLIQHRQHFSMERDIGDFILKRKDGLFAYQLAVVVDDHDQNVTHVIRGADLLDSTPRQLYLARCLGFASPEFGHVPVMVDQGGQKLSKQAHARAITASESTDALKLALQMLNQPIPPESDNQRLLESAVRNWTRSNIPAQTTLPTPLS